MKLVKYRKSRTRSPVPVSRQTAPFRPMQRWQREIKRLFGDPLGHWLAPEEPPVEDWMPAVNVYDEKDKFVVEAEIPGMKKDEIRIYMSGDNLNITGQRREKRAEKARNTCRAERHFGQFHRTISLPGPINADAIEAHSRDGILTITCPKFSTL
jgi:HSP20 family protein